MSEGKDIWVLDPVRSKFRFYVFGQQPSRIV